MRKVNNEIETLREIIQSKFFSPALGYPIASKHPSLPSNTAGITSDKAEAHTSFYQKARRKLTLTKGKTKHILSRCG